MDGNLPNSAENTPGTPDISIRHVKYAGIGLILLGIALMIAEALGTSLK